MSDPTKPRPLYVMAHPTTPEHCRRPESAGFDPADEADILAQPVVVKALLLAAETLAESQRACILALSFSQQAEQSAAAARVETERQAGYMRGLAEGRGEAITAEKALAHPAVVEALRKAYSEGCKAGWEQGFADACSEDD